MPNGPSTTATKQAIRFSELFREVSTSCPVEVASYGTCLAEITTDIKKHACEQEFRNLKKCFNRALRKPRK